MNSLLRAVALSIVIAASGSMVTAQDYQKGFDAYDAGDFETALQEWRPLAEQGNATAQTNLGLMYELGNGVPRDYAEAVTW